MHLHNKRRSNHLDWSNLQLDRFHALRKYLLQKSINEFKKVPFVLHSSSTQRGRTFLTEVSYRLQLFYPLRCHCHRLMNCISALSSQFSLDIN